MAERGECGSGEVTGDGIEKHDRSDGGAPIARHATSVHRKSPESSGSLGNRQPQSPHGKYSGSALPLEVAHNTREHSSNPSTSCCTRKGADTPPTSTPLPTSDPKRSPVAGSLFRRAPRSSASARPFHRGAAWQDALKSCTIFSRLAGAPLVPASALHDGAPLVGEIELQNSVAGSSVSSALSIWSSEGTGEAADPHPPIVVESNVGKKEVVCGEDPGGKLACNDSSEVTPGNQLACGEAKGELPGKGLDAGVLKDSSEPWAAIRSAPTRASRVGKGEVLVLRIAGPKDPPAPVGAEAGKELLAVTAIEAAEVEGRLLPSVWIGTGAEGKGEQGLDNVGAAADGSA
eukprot:RCo029862